MGYLESQLRKQKARLKFLEKNRERLRRLNHSREINNTPEKKIPGLQELENIDNKINDVYSEFSVLKIRRMMSLL